MPPRPHVLNRSYLPSDLIPHLRRNHVAGAIVVQAIHSLQETAWLLELSTQNDFILGVVGWVDLAGADLPAVLERLMENPRFVGVRHQTDLEPNEDWLIHSHTLRGLREMARRGLPFDLLISPRHLPLVPRLMAEVPDLRVVIDHLAKPGFRSDVFPGWKKDLATVAALPGVYCKVSGMMTEGGPDGWSTDRFAPYFEHLVNAFGYERLMWGSDWPVSLMAASYDHVFSVSSALPANASQPEREAFFSGNALTFYRIDRNLIPSAATGHNSIP